VRSRRRGSHPCAARFGAKTTPHLLSPSHAHRHVLAIEILVPQPAPPAAATHSAVATDGLWFRRGQASATGQHSGAAAHTPTGPVLELPLDSCDLDSRPLAVLLRVTALWQQRAVPRSSSPRYRATSRQDAAQSSLARVRPLARSEAVQPSRRPRFLPRPAPDRFAGAGG
jgi:hypothetical protein